MADELITVTVDTTQVTRALGELQASLATGFTAPLTGTKKFIEGETARRFQTSDGGGWAPVKDATLKQRKFNTANEPLVDTGELMRSVTEDGAPHAILHENPFGLEIGTDRVDANRHQFGSADGHEPARPFLFLSTEDQVGIVTIFAEDLDVRLSRVTR